MSQVIEYGPEGAWLFGVWLRWDQWETVIEIMESAMDEGYSDRSGVEPLPDEIDPHLLDPGGGL